MPISTAYRYLKVLSEELLLKNSHMPMDEQKKILDNTFEAWKGDQDQVDDVLVIGMHV